MISNRDMPYVGWDVRFCRSCIVVTLSCFIQTIFNYLKFKINKSQKRVLLFI